MKHDETPGDAGHLRPAWHLLFLVVSLFFLWGVANNLNDILIKQFKKAFELSDFQAGLVQSAFYFGYFTFAIPAAMFMRRFGYKGAIVLGLLFYACGAFLFYPPPTTTLTACFCWRCTSSPAAWPFWKPPPIR